MPHREPRRATQEEFERLNRFPDGLDACGALRAELAGSSLNRCSVLDPLDPEKQLVQEKLLHGGFTVQESRAIASLLGNVIGDSLGAPLEFSPVRYGSTELKDFGQQEVWSKPGYNSFGLKPGQWTDDASMALCLADTLLVHQRLEPQDLRLRFLNWWAFGYNNAFGYDTASARHGGSVGLGGNISQSMSEFYRHRTPYTEAGDRYTSGNGSLMRNGPVPVFFAHEREAALDAAYKQSKTTHQGDEAAAACQLLTHVVVAAINHESREPAAIIASVLGELGTSFTTDCYGVQCVARSEQEQRCAENKTSELADRNWNWKHAEYRYSPHRAAMQPGYIGSYAMDNIAMSLHCIWTTTSFTAALLKAANLRGDSDSVCAVVGQMAGAIYGVEAIPHHWIQLVQRWDNNGDVALKAWKLYHHSPLRAAPAPAPAPADATNVTDEAATHEATTTATTTTMTPPAASAESDTQ